MSNGLTIFVHATGDILECPFAGSRNSCGAMEKQSRINACPVCVDDENGWAMFIPPDDCPLKRGHIQVILVETYNGNI